jgi:hypothetical protein
MAHFVEQQGTGAPLTQTMAVGPRRRLLQAAMQTIFNATGLGLRRGFSRLFLWLTESADGIYAQFAGNLSLLLL